MAGAINFEELKNDLKQKGVDTCIVDLSIGGTSVREANVILREYLAQGKSPKYLILGMAADSLLPGMPTYSPFDFTGNGALSLLWSKWSDVFSYFPGFPFRYFDSGFRFLINRATGFGIFQSLLAEKIQKFQHRLAKVSEGPTNQFGAIDVMRDFGAEIQKNFLPRLEMYRKPEDSWGEHPSFTEIRRMAKTLNAKLLVVELPTVSWFHKVGFKSTVGQAYLHWLKSDLTNNHEEFLNLSLEGEILDGDFSDRIHLSSRGAIVFTDALSKAIFNRRDSIQ